MKLRSLYLAALLAAPLLIQAAPASAGGFRAGTYTLTFYSGPSHSESATQCLTFSKTGGVVGFRNSGTWDSPTFAGWGGNYVSDVGYLRFYGTFGGGASVTNMYIKMTNFAGGFDDWFVSAPPISAANDGEVTLTAGCDDARMTHHAGDPTH